MRTKDAGRPSGGLENSKETANPSRPAVIAGMGGDDFFVGTWNRPRMLASCIDYL